MKISTVTIFTIILASFTLCQSYKILVLVPFPGPSHWLMFKVFIKELISRGHEVTTITAIKFNENMQNYTEIYIDPPYDWSTDTSVPDPYKCVDENMFEKLSLYWRIGLRTSEHAFQSQNIKNFIKRKDLSFDLIIAEQFYQESFLVFAHKYKAPIVTIATFGYSDFMDRAMGSLTPWSHVPHMLLLDWGDNMSFSQRCFNVFLSSVDMIVRNFYYIPHQNKLAQQNFAAAIEGEIPSVSELEKSISFILVNSHSILEKPRPKMPGLINVGGAHIKPSKKLPTDLQAFLDSAKDGVIYFSLGAFVQVSKMPKENVQIILNVFSKLKQKVLWKWEDDNIPNLPKNVRVQNWMPQSDILAHPNTILFVSHGGMFGTSEGIYYGIPMLFIPFFGDQYRNADLAINAGFARKLLFNDITEETFLENLNLLLYDKTYYKNAKKISNIFNDNPLKPMDQAMFWIEYAVRHQGAPHLKSSAVNLNWLSYLLLDVLGLFIIVLVITIFTIQKIIKLLCCKSNLKKKEKQKKK